MAAHQIKVYAGDDTKGKWEAICEGFTSNVAAFTALVEAYFWRHQMGPADEDEPRGEPTPPPSRVGRRSGLGVEEGGAEGAEEADGVGGVGGESAAGARDM